MRIMWTDAPCSKYRLVVTGGRGSLGDAVAPVKCKKILFLHFATAFYSYFCLPPPVPTGLPNWLRP